MTEVLTICYESSVKLLQILHTLMPCQCHKDSTSISHVLCRVLKALKQRLEDTIAEKKASQNFKIEGAGNIPKTMQVKQSPVMQNGSGKT